MISTAKLYQLTIVIFYVILTLPIFNEVYYISKQIIDEEFHLRQGLHYCKGNFEIWDQKITTFPGLYIASTLLYYPFSACNVYNLRLTSFIASCLNIYLIYEIRGKHSIHKIPHAAYTALEALTISLLPPLYFFGQLYYTDVLTVTTLLFMINFSTSGNHFLGSIFGFLSVIMRQTSIIWVAMYFGYNALDDIMAKNLHYIHTSKSQRKSHRYSLKDILLTIKLHLTNLNVLFDTLRILFTVFIGYIIVICLFIGFLLYNKSIVVGDKSAHEAALHLPQIFYFSLFFSIFGVSTIITNILQIFKIIRRRLILVLIVSIVFIVIIYYNTIVHPYLLADNRHYTFYIWNRIFGRYSWTKYAAIPFYIISCVNILITLKSKSTGFIIFYTISLILTISLQQLIEIRYFIVPFLILRLSKFKPKVNYLICEFLFYIIINFITFYIFFTKEIYWNDYEEAQRLIW